MKACEVVMRFGRINMVKITLRTALAYCLHLQYCQHSMLTNVEVIAG